MALHSPEISRLLCMMVCVILLSQMPMMMFVIYPNQFNSRTKQPADLLESWSLPPIFPLLEPHLFPVRVYPRISDEVLSLDNNKPHDSRASGPTLVTNGHPIKALSHDLLLNICRHTPCKLNHAVRKTLFKMKLCIRYHRCNKGISDEPSRSGHRNIDIRISSISFSYINYNNVCPVRCNEHDVPTMSPYECHPCHICPLCPKSRQVWGGTETCQDPTEMCSCTAFYILPYWMSGLWVTILRQEKSVTSSSRFYLMGLCSLKCGSDQTIAVLTKLVI